MSTVVHLASSGAAEYARELLERCEAGEIIAITAAEEYPDGTYSVGGTAVKDRLRCAGMLLEAAMTRLNQDTVA